MISQEVQKLEEDNAALREQAERDTQTIESLAEEVESLQNEISKLPDSDWLGIATRNIEHCLSELRRTHHAMKFRGEKLEQSEMLSLIEELTKELEEIEF